MINCYFYKNGYQIKGHAHITICTLVTAMSWACASSISQIDKTSHYHTSSYDNSDVGYSVLTFNHGIEKAKWVFDEFKYHITEWCKKEYPNQIVFEEVDSILKVGD